jgi:hypothetical protein
VTSNQISRVTIGEGLEVEDEIRGKRGRRTGGAGGDGTKEWQRSRSYVESGRREYVGDANTSSDMKVLVCSMYRGRGDTIWR